MNKLPKEYIVKCEDVTEVNQVLHCYYGESSKLESNWTIAICKSDLRSTSSYKYKGDAFDNIIHSGFKDLPVFTYSQWKEMYYNEEEFVLPEKWWIETKDKEELDEIVRWFKNKFLFNFTPSYPNSKCWRYSGEKDFGHSLIYRDNYSYVKNHIKITFEQFKKHILKEEEMKTYTLEELVNNKTVVVYLDNVNEWNALRDTELFYMCGYNGQHCYCLVDGTFSTSSSKTKLGAYGEDVYKTYNTIVQFNQINFNKKENTMRQEFSIEGSTALKTAFVQEAGLTTFSANSVKGTYLTSATSVHRVVCDTDSKKVKHFKLPEQYTEALAYVKGYYTPEAKKMYFGNTEFTVYKTYAECSQGSISKAEVKKVVDWLDTKITILGYDMNLAVSESNFIQFGCISGTAEQAKAILAEMK